MARIRAAGIALAMIVSVAGGSAAFGDDGADSGTAVSPSQAAGQSVSDARDSGATPAGAAEVKAGEVGPTGGDATPQASEGDAAEAGMPAAEAGESSEETVVPEENGEDAVSKDGPAAEAGDSPVTGFSDVPVSHAQHSSIMWLAGKGITSGWEDGTFKPDSVVSREAMAAFLYRYAGSPDYAPPVSSPFKDVPVSHPNYREISWAAAAGLATGYSDGTFRPAAAVARGDAAAVFWKLAGTPAAPNRNPFVDVGVANAQRPAILWLAGAGIARGNFEHKYLPDASLVRSDFAVFLHRYDSARLGVKATAVSPAKEPAAPQGKSFRDVGASNPFREDIEWLAATGIADGYSDGAFRPDSAVSREEMAAFLYRYAGSPEFAPPASTPFKDVPVSHPFYREIAWAAASGILGGYADGTFRPSAELSRAAMASFLYRAAGGPASPRGENFSDTGCSEHRTAMSWLAGAGIATGSGDGKFRPDAPLDRQTLAAFLHRMCAKGLGVVASPWSKAAATTDTVPASCSVKQPAGTKVDCSKVSCVAFTFDDGPHPIHTGRILDVLKRHNARATFFVVGTNVVRYPALIRREIAEGHLVGSHSWDHPDLATLDFDALRSQLAQTDVAIANALGFQAGSATPSGMWASGSMLRTRYMRPPYGSADAEVYSVLGQRGQTAVLWNIDTVDWKHKDAVLSTNNVLNGIQPGAIVLWHDIQPAAENALDGLMTTLEQQGYHFVTVEELTDGRQVPGGSISQR